MRDLHCIGPAAVNVRREHCDVCIGSNFCRGIIFSSLGHGGGLPALLRAGVQADFCGLVFDADKYFPDALADRATGIMNLDGQLSGMIALTFIGYPVTVNQGSLLPAFLFLSACSRIASIIAASWVRRKYAL
ncbi:hypothetical protein HT746_00755 [Burkholderia pyrrocinia]|uniref:hypothetical protein n=1 Tax=Burkholderia pyrrocinia TaxID=60550 RepID=UPI001575B41D|nr:hypothetical protein [Burkholderia pyrrocinia]NTX25695.1 hypothetical protein [Burkholderia pyrrocinia]QVN23009.1 hypothetical protein JYG32_36865 [Burkholderia pyrrocinia]